MDVKIECLNKEIKPTYGGTRVLVTYEMKTTGHNVTENNYTIVAEIKGIESLDLWLDVISVERHNNNEDTLVDEAVIDIFSDY